MKRSVDDQPTASQASTTRGKDSVNSYKQICKELNLELTQGCQDCDKAVTNSRCGKVLGFCFSMADLTLQIQKERIRPPSSYKVLKS